MTGTVKGILKTLLFNASFLVAILLAQKYWSSIGPCVDYLANWPMKDNPIFNGALVGSFVWPLLLIYVLFRRKSEHP